MSTLAAMPIPSAPANTRRLANVGTTGLFWFDLDPRVAAPRVVAESRVGRPFAEVEEEMLGDFLVEASLPQVFGCQGLLFRHRKERRLAWKYTFDESSSAAITIGRPSSEEELAAGMFFPDRQYLLSPARDADVPRVTGFRRWAVKTRLVPGQAQLGVLRGVVEVRSYFDPTRACFVSEPAELVEQFDPRLYGSKWERGMRLQRRESLLDREGRVYKQEIWWERG